MIRINEEIMEKFMRESVAFAVSTKDEDSQLIRFLHDKGYSWNNNQCLFEFDAFNAPSYRSESKIVIYNVSKPYSNHLAYSRYESNNCEIINASDFIIESITIEK